jgi:hypothetical protein
MTGTTSVAIQPLKCPPGLKLVDRESEIGKKLLSIFGVSSPADDEDVEWVIRNRKMYSDGELHVAWFWDGDGTLVVGYNGRFAINDDCKKAANWEWV